MQLGETRVILSTFSHRTVQTLSCVFPSTGTRKPALDANGVVWPVMFIYPETMQNDAVEAFHEHHAVADHLDTMFGEAYVDIKYEVAYL